MYLKKNSDFFTTKSYYIVVLAFVIGVTIQLCGTFYMIFNLLVYITGRLWPNALLISFDHCNCHQFIQIFYFI